MQDLRATPAGRHAAFLVTTHKADSALKAAATARITMHDGGRLEVTAQLASVADAVASGAAVCAR